jgi:HlyD family secretion protein
MKPLLRIVVGVVLAVAAVAVLAGIVTAALRASRPLPDILQGQIEATQVNVSAKIAGRIEELRVREGDRVAAGEAIVRLSSPEIDARLAQARAATVAARAQRDKAFVGARDEELRQARATWQRARTGTELAEKTFARLERLHADGVVPAQRRDEADAQLRAAREAEETARAVYDMAVAGARDEDKRTADATVERALGSISEVEAFLKETTVVAPIDGEVVRRVAEPGELVGPGAPIVTILDVRQPWAVFQLREDRLEGLRVGDRFTARLPALPGRDIEFEVYYLAAQADFATFRPTSQQGGFDVKTFEVRARPTGQVDGLRPGMSVIVSGPTLAGARPPSGRP